MIDVESLCERFKFGDIDSIFISIYSYLLIGFFILFATYEQKFLSLDLHAQIFLMLGISYPISCIFAGLLDDFEDGPKEESYGYGYFYRSAKASVMASIWYISFFSLFYIIKHMDVFSYNDNFDQIIALIIILSGFVFANSMRHFANKEKQRPEPVTS